MHSVIRRPLVTEKNTILAAAGVYAFEVDTKATKETVKKAVEQAFQVKVDSVRTLNCRDRSRRTMRAVSKVRYWKKALVKLQPGQKIELFEGA